MYLFLINLVFVCISAYAVPGAHGNACLRCHGNHPPQASSQPIAPVWEQQFSMNWNMYEVKGDLNPPFDVIPADHPANRGETHYDWPERKMIEIYQDRCINIFPSGNNFSCKFISDHDQTYLIKYPIGNLSKPDSCCRMTGGKFWAPRPDALQIMSFQKQSVAEGQAVDWWTLDIPLPGPFGWGFMRGTNRPVAFWFPSLDGWVQQNFNNFTPAKPDPKVFEIPKICSRKLSVCDL